MVHVKQVDTEKIIEKCVDNRNRCNSFLWTVEDNTTENYDWCGKEVEHRARLNAIDLKIKDQQRISDNERKYKTERGNSTRRVYTFECTLIHSFDHNNTSL